MSLTTSQSELIDILLHDPLNFKAEDFTALVNSFEKPDKPGQFDTEKGFAVVRDCVKRIYDLNENSLLETSNANTGPLGKFNKESTEKRQKEYYKRLEKQKPGKKYTRIYAEGDSWFQFPVFIKDIIDWLNKNDNYLLYPDAYGGDWITNIIYEGQYIEGLTTHMPDVFLISGGGNDMVGNSRMAVMVSKNPDRTVKYESASALADYHLESYVEQMILRAQPYITKDFYAFIWTMKLQYTLLFKGLYFEKSKFSEMISITQGYAYPFPKKGNNFRIDKPMQYVVNNFAKTGQWLFRPLAIRGILDQNIQRAIVTTFIFEFNEMLIEVGKHFDKVYHVDARSIPIKQSDWYDELHLQSKVFKRVAKLFEKIIDSRGEGMPKVVKER